MNVSFREPRATPPSFAQKLDAVSINYQINSIPNAFISGHQSKDAKTSAIELAASDVTQTLAKLQSFKFSPGTQTLQFSVQDGNSGNLSWNGLYNGPSYSYGIGQAQFGTNSIATISKLQQLRTDIYASPKPSQSGAPETITGTVPVRLKKVLENLIKNFLSYLNTGSVTGLEKDILTVQHQQNQEGLQIWYDILQQSEDNESLIGSNSYTELDEAIADHITRVYLSNSGSFLNTMLQFGNDFRLTYLPPSPSTPAAQYGKLKGTSKIISDGAKSKKINLEQFEADISGFNVPPVTAVWVMGEGNVAMKGGAQIGLQVYGIWPKTAGTYDGGVQRVAPPPWVPTPQPLNVGTSPTKTILGSGAESIVKANQSQLSDIAKKHFNIFTEWARLWFVDLKYANESATVTTPLDLTWEVGQFYNVTTDKGFLFRGMAERINHRLTTRDAVTTVSFSHVQYQ